MKNALRATYSIPIHDHSMAQTLEEIMNEAIQLKPGFKCQLDSVSFNVITYEGNL